MILIDAGGPNRQAHPSLVMNWFPGPNSPSVYPLIVTSLPGYVIPERQQISGFDHVSQRVQGILSSKRGSTAARFAAVSVMVTGGPVKGNADPGNHV